jgi:CheY-like chemotaxis protein
MPRILIIDEGRPRAEIRAILEGKGYQAQEADDAEGLRALRREPFDLLVCDVSLRHRDGMETLQQVLREFPGLPVVALCGGNLEASRSLLYVARLWGAAQTLTRPFSTHQLLDAVSRAVGSATPKRWTSCGSESGRPISKRTLLSEPSRAIHPPTAKSSPYPGSA